MESSERMRLARRYAGLSQARLASAIGVQRSAVGHWESAEGSHPSTANLGAVARATGVQFEWLATGRGEMALTREQHDGSVSAALGLLVDDPLEMRLVRACRGIPARARVSLVELVELMVAGRANTRRKKS